MNGHAPHTVALLLAAALFGCGDDPAEQPAADPDLVKLRASAEAGHPGAQFQLGEKYRTGNGVEKDMATAVEWFRRSAKSGYASAQHNLATALEFGQGTTEDDTQALDWYLKAAIQGLPAAQFSLGRMHLRGHGTDTNATIAARWFRQAASEGHREAILHLGLMHRDGLGLPRDFLQAGKFFLMAANQGVLEGQAEYHQLAPLLKPAQRALAQKLAKEEANRQVPRPSLGGTIEFRDGLVYTAGGKTPYTGKASLMHPNGLTSREIHVENGRLHGWENTWHPNGTRATRVLYDGGRRHGSMIEWYSNGAVRLQATNHLGRLLNATAYNPAGKATSRVIEGNGTLVIHHLEGWKTAERTFIEGKLKATRRWDANGTALED